MIKGVLNCELNGIFLENGRLGVIFNGIINSGRKIVWYGEGRENFNVMNLMFLVEGRLKLYYCFF